MVERPSAIANPRPFPAVAYMPQSLFTPKLNTALLGEYNPLRAQIAFHDQTEHPVK